MSTKLFLVRRWGQNPAGQTLTVEDDAQAAWLLDHNYAQRSKTSTSASDNAAAPGTDGPDLRAGGDGTRRRPTSMRSTDERENRAWPVAGSPVQYNAGVAPASQAGDGGDEQAQDTAKEPTAKATGSRRKTN
jgi:hypothetical protein